MPLIKRRPKDTLKPITFRLPELLVEKLNNYADFVNVPQSEIVAEAIKYAIESDKEFSTECTQSAISNATEPQQKRTADHSKTQAPEASATEHNPSVSASRKSTATA